MIAEGKKLTSRPRIDAMSSEYPRRPKRAPWTAISTTGSPIATAYHHRPTRQRTMLRNQLRIDVLVYQVRMSTATAGPNWAIIENIWPRLPRQPSMSGSQASQVIAYASTKKDATG